MIGLNNTEVFFIVLVIIDCYMQQTAIRDIATEYFICYLKCEYVDIHDTLYLLHVRSCCISEPYHIIV